MNIHYFCNYNANNSKLPAKQVVRKLCMERVSAYCKTCPFCWDHYAGQPLAADGLIKLFKLEPE